MRKYLYNPAKARENKRKHGVGFSEAESVFDDPAALLTYDAEHSVFEDRWKIIGVSDRLRSLLVVHTVVDEDLIRIVSARRATRAEELLYAANLEDNP